MRDFADIYAIAAERKGGAPALEALLAGHKSKSPGEIAAIPDDRILSLMTRHVFQAGFSWKVIEAKWPGFEAAFDGFEPHACAAMPETKFDALLKDTRIVRNAAKIKSVMANARFVLDLAAERGSAGKFVADWPDSDYAGLLELIKKRADRLGGQSAMYFLRALGKPSFITSMGVIAALKHEGVIEKEPSSKRDFQAVQAAFNRWSEQSGRDLTAISRTLAMSVDDGPAAAH